MERLEYEITRDFIVDLGNFLEDKNPKNFNWEFIRDKYYLFKGENFSNIRELELNARFIKSAIVEKESNQHSYKFDQLNMKYLILTYNIIKDTDYIDDFNDVVSNCYLQIFKNIVDFNKIENTLYIKNCDIFDFLEKEDYKSQLLRIVDLIHEEDETFKLVIVPPKY